MRLWHQDLISYLPDKQLLGQHREICGLRGLGFGRKHKIVDYIFKYPYSNLYHFHLIVMKEMEKQYCCDTIYLSVVPENTKAIHIYEKAGFASTGIEIGNETHKEVIYKCQL